MPTNALYLFGGDHPWDASLWTASDDTVRNGTSSSFLTVTSPESALFHGHLNATTLGGSGFASQRTVGELALDLADFDGLALSLGAGASAHVFTLTIKDTIPPPTSDGRDQSGVSWETDFEPPAEGGCVEFPWDHFRATYRGRDVEDPTPLDLGAIKRVSLMVRSFFGSQEGDFKLAVNAIEATKISSETRRSDDDDDLQKRAPVETPPKQPLWRRLLCGLV